jgi:hypothetical protein
VIDGVLGTETRICTNDMREQRPGLETRSATMLTTKH